MNRAEPPRPPSDRVLNAIQRIVIVLLVTAIYALYGWAQGDDAMAAASDKQAAAAAARNPAFVDDRSARKSDK